MKKLLFTSAIFLLAITANAQVQFGIKAGVNIANVNYKNNDMSVDTKMKLGIHIGAIIDIPLGESFAFQPGMLFSQKGAIEDHSFSELGINYNDKTIYKLNYLDIPINAVLKLNAGSAKILISTGPFISYALNGKKSTENTIFGITVSEDKDIEFGREKGQTKRLDYGICIGAGVQFNKILVATNYNLGLSNTLSGGDNNNFIKNSIFSISLGILFGGK